MTEAATVDSVPGARLPTRDEPVTACHECGAVSRLDTSVYGSRQVCGCCGGFLRRPRLRSSEYCLVFTIAAALLFILANVFPFVSMEIEGLGSSMYLISAGAGLYNLGQPVVGVIVFMATIVLPLIQILCNLYVMGSMHFGQRWPGVAWVFRTYTAIGPWAMLDVFFLGVLVAYVKLLSLAHMELGEGFYAFIFAMVLLIAAQANLDSFQVWNTLRRQMTFGELERAGGRQIVSCHDCGQLVFAPRSESHGHAHCPRCGAALHHRKSQSVARSWALLIAAAAFYVPANVLPVSTIVSFGKAQSDTIMSGVIELIKYGEYPIAILLFTASIMVPILKIVCLAFLLISVQRKSTWRPRERTKLYRVVELVGRWSMVDIFVIGILGALVSLGSLATIEPGPAALAFASVVILTMLAAEAFDPRLIWDPVQQDMTDGQRIRA